MENIQRLKFYNSCRERTENKLSYINKKRGEVIEELQKHPPRLKVTPQVIELRMKALKNPEVRSVMERYHLSIKDVALVKLWGEMHLSEFYSAPIDEAPESFLEHNQWQIAERYLYGGPGDKMKLVFRESENHRIYFCGFIMNFPLKSREKAA